MDKSATAPAHRLTGQAVRVVVIDDDEWLRLSTAALLEGEGFEVRTYNDGDSFLAQPGALAADCVLLDLDMPGRSGLHVLRMLGRRDHAPSILILTGHGDVGLAVEAMKIGAADFLEKPASPAALIQAVEAAASRCRKLREKIEARRSAEARLCALTNRQREILAAMVEGQANKVIAYQLGLSVRTVEAYRAGLMDRIGARSTAEAVCLAVAAGLTPRR